MTTIRAFLLHMWLLFSNFRNRAGETSPSPSSYAPEAEPVQSVQMNIYQSKENIEKTWKYLDDALKYLDDTNR